MDIHEKRRLKQGGYDKEETAQFFMNELKDIDEFVIVCQYKDGTLGGLNSTSDGIRLVGMLEHAKMMVMDSEPGE